MWINALDGYSAATASVAGLWTRKNHTKNVGAGLDRGDIGPALRAYDIFPFLR
jgi:hypothetical protein